jgi:3-hydroxyacyl-CoA dehydrogenase
MGPFQTADVAAVDVFIETLEARHATRKARLCATERTQDAEHAVEIAAEREKVDKAVAELLRVADRSATLAAERALPSWWWLAG